MTTHDKSHSVSQEEIMNMLSAKAKELADLHSTAIKHTALSKLLSNAVEALPADTRLPGIRDLAQCLGTSLVTTQRAVTDLTTQGVLYSKPRSGVFVRDQHGDVGSPGPSFGPPAPPRARHPFRTNFDFGTDSHAPYQRNFWEELTGVFGSLHPNTVPVLHFENDVLQARESLDAYERHEWLRYPKGDNDDDILDLEKFAGSLLPVQPTPKGLLPLYYRTYFLFFNRTLLERHKLPLPDYRTFPEQLDYIKKMAPLLERHGFDPHPYSIQEPVTLFGSWISKFSRLFDEETLDQKLRRELIKAIDELTSYCHLCRYSIKTRYDWMQSHDEFLKGRSPFFLGYSVDYWEFSQKKLPFSLGAYPTLCCDDSFFLWTRGGAISSHSEHPVEALNFLTFLLRPEIQKRFAETGHFGANADRLAPKMAADPAWVSSVLKKSSPFHVAPREHYYIAINILGSEIWRSLQEEVSSADILDRTVQLGRSYLRHSLQRESGNARRKRAAAVK